MRNETVKTISKHLATIIILVVLAGLIAAMCVIPKVVFGIGIPAFVYWLIYTCVEDAMEDLR